MVTWQIRLSKLFRYMLRHGMPMEQLRIASFKEMLFQSRNTEECLLVALNGCSRLSKQLSIIDELEPTTFGAWFRRIQGQRGTNLVSECLSLLDLRAADSPQKTLLVQISRAVIWKAVLASLHFLDRPTSKESTWQEPSS